MVLSAQGPNDGHMHVVVGFTSRKGTLALSKL